MLRKPPPSKSEWRKWMDAAKPFKEFYGALNAFRGLGATYGGMLNYLVDELFSVCFNTTN